MEIDLSTKQTYAEVDSFIEMLSEKERNKIPKKLRDTFKDNKDINYNKDVLELIENNKLKKETLAIIAFLNLKYWCENEEEKQYLNEIYNDNEKKYQEHIKRKYNPDNIFNNTAKTKTISPTESKENVQVAAQKETQVKQQGNIAQNIELVETKGNFFQKIIKKIKTFFEKK